MNALFNFLASGIRLDSNGAVLVSVHCVDGGWVAWLPVPPEPDFLVV